MAKVILICIKITINDLIEPVNKLFPNKKRKHRAAITANNKFEIGQAAATLTMSSLGFLKYLTSTGTGFAQPKPINNKAIEPTGSR